MGTISLSTILGLLIGFGLLAISIFLSTDHYSIFFNLQGLLMVLGGTIAATMISFEGRYVWKSFQAILTTFLPAQVSPDILLADVKKIIRWSKAFRQNKISGENLDRLQKEFRNADINSDFLKMCVSYVLDGHSGVRLKSMLDIHLETVYERQMVQARIINAMATIAPAFGMIGTILGLMVMLDNLGNDLSKLGPGMALALLTTFYGILISQLIFKPAARKLQQMNEMYRFRNRLAATGFVMLVEMKSPLEIQDYLNSFLDPAIHLKLVSRGKSASK